MPDTFVPEDMICPFRTHQGKTLGYIADVDLLYLDWMNGLDIKNPKLLRAVAEICVKWSREIDRLVDERDERYG